MKKTLLAIVIIFAVLGIGLGIGFQYGKLQVPPASPEDLDFSLFWEAWQTIEKYYVDPEKIDHQQMIYGAIKGMIEALDDPHTVFMKPEDLKIFQENVVGEFEGVGMEIGIREDRLTIIAPLEGTPADRAGLRAGDKITMIDHKDTHDMPIDVAVSLLRGPKNTTVTLTIFREGWIETEEFVIIRDVIKIPSLKWELLQENIAYINLYYFSETAHADFNAAAKEILNSPAEKIILDLRNNTGGYLHTAQYIASWFLEKGDVVAIEERVPGEEEKIYRAEGPSELLPYEMLVLINQGSASASEILAGALRDNRGIQLIGEKTFGKGSIQQLKELREGGLKITVTRWLTPQGHLINNIGLEPDITVEMTEEDYKQGWDPQLDKALELIKEMR